MGLGLIWRVQKCVQTVNVARLATQWASLEDVGSFERLACIFIPRASDTSCEPEHASSSYAPI